MNNEFYIITLSEIISLQADKEIAEGKLEAARPALEEAESALQTIKAADISTVRKLAKPPHLIMRIMDCVLILFQRRLDLLSQDPDRPSPKPSWAESLKVLVALLYYSYCMRMQCIIEY